MIQTLLADLEAFPDRLAACFAEFPVPTRNWWPDSWDGIPSERLTAIEQLGHVRDIERDGYHVRIQRTLAEAGPVLEDIPGEPLALERQYLREDADAMLREFRVARARTIALVEGLTEAQMQRVAIFEGKPTTLRGLLHFLSSHDNQHLAGLHWLLGKMQKSSVGR